MMESIAVQYDASDIVADQYMDAGKILKYPACGWLCSLCSELIRKRLLLLLECLSNPVLQRSVN